MFKHFTIVADMSSISFGNGDKNEDALKWIHIYIFAQDQCEMAKENTHTHLYGLPQDMNKTTHFCRYTY